MNTPTPNQPYSPTHDDEIDLFELFQTLWEEKVLIVLITLVCTIAAALYAFTAQPQYSVSMTLKPAPLSLYGELVAGMEGDANKSIGLGRSTAEQILGQFANNLQLRANRAQNATSEGVLGLNVTTDNARNTQIAQWVTIQLSTLQPDGAVEVLQNYVDAVSESTLQELNSFVQGLGNPVAITKEMLYTVDAISSQARLNKPNKKLIVAVGIVLGGMLGVFAALIRSMIRKRKNAM